MDERLRRTARLFRHASWANALVARAVAEHALDPRAARILAHMLAAEWVWLRRLGVEAPPAAAVWPSWTAAESLEQIAPLAAAWNGLLEGLDAAGLERVVPYTSARGEPWTGVVGDLLEHVLLHASHHRGQLVLLLREAGVEPPLVDFAHAARAGLIPG